MLERMEKARDFRRAAWEGLGKGGWFPSILGYLFNVFTIGLAAVAIVIMEVVLANNFGIFEFLTAMAMATIRRGARFGHAVSGYGHGWSTTWLMALVGMYQCFWTLLFIVPGIRAFYSYRLVYFLRIDRPELPAAKVIAESKRLMAGRRWKLFCLDIRPVPRSTRISSTATRPAHSARSSARTIDGRGGIGER